jgi:hypothetical protein
MTLVFVLFSTSFHKWKKTCNTCLCEIGLFHWTWWSPVPSIFQQMT